jgi:hypothetical protein
MKSRSGMSRPRTSLKAGKISVHFGKTRKPGERRFIVSIASNLGGGRQIIYASNPKDAGKRAMMNAFLIERTGLQKSSLSIIVTDTSKKMNAQTFFGKMG